MVHLKAGPLRVPEVAFLSGEEVAQRPVGLTNSGASMVRIASPEAEAFFAALGVRGPDEIWVALAAFDDHATMVGAAVLGATPADRSRMMVAVVPEQRRLSVGTDLLHALLAEARRSDLQVLRISYPSSDTAADSFLQASGLVAGRQLLNGVMTVVLAA